MNMQLNPELLEAVHNSNEVVVVLDMALLTMAGQIQQIEIRKKRNRVEPGAESTFMSMLIMNE